MADHAYIGELLAGIVYLIVGVRLLRLGQRTREVPERLLGAMFLLSGASYIVYEMANLPGLESLWTPLNFAGRVIYIGAPILLVVFTRQVFRPYGSTGRTGSRALYVRFKGGQPRVGAQLGAKLGADPRSQLSSCSTCA